MQQIDFYILPQDDFDSCIHFITSLCAKVYQQQKSLDITASSAKIAKTLSQSLWSFRPTSFIPHRLTPMPISPHSLAIRTLGQLEKNSKILLNLAPELNPDWIRYERMLQIVFNEASFKEKTRKIYQQLKQQGFAIRTHQLSAAIPTDTH